MAYEDIIESAAKQFSIDPNLIRAFIKVESNWDPSAYRAEPQLNTGSYGLMQLLLTTARDVSGNSSLSEAQLIDPTINITLGAQYLRMLMNKYGNLDDVIASYNAGSPRTSLLGVGYVNQGYVDKVKMAYTFYQAGWMAFAGFALVGGLVFYTVKRR